jgi:hypothetical protein
MHREMAVRAEVAARRSAASDAGEGARTTGQPGSAKMFPSGPTGQGCAGEAGPLCPRSRKDLWPPAASAARARLREPRKRRKLTTAGRPPPGRPSTAGPEGDRRCMLAGRYAAMLCAWGEGSGACRDQPKYGAIGHHAERALIRR